MAPFMIAFCLIAFIAAALAIAVASGGRAALDLAGRLGGSATVAVQGAGLESADATAARAAEILSSVRGVAQVRTLDQTASDRLIASLINSAAPGPSGDVRLLAVSFTPRSTLSAAALSAPLRVQGVSAAIDDHRLSTSRLWRGAVLLGLGSAGAAIGLLVATWLVARLAVRRCLDRQMSWLQLLHALGASDGLVICLVRTRLAARVAVSSAIGAALALLAATAWRVAGRSPDIAWNDLIAGPPWILAAVMLAMIVTSLSTRAVLQRTP